MAHAFSRGDIVRHPDFAGVALWYLGPATELAPILYDELDEEYEQVEIEGTSEVVMVGDDQVHRVSTEDLTAVDEGEYCPGCGQVGCAWGAVS